MLLHNLLDVAWFKTNLFILGCLPLWKDWHDIFGIFSLLSSKLQFMQCERGYARASTALDHVQPCHENPFT